MSTVTKLKNLIRNPKPAAKTGWVTFKAYTVFTGSEMRISGTTGNSYATFAVDGLMPGDYVASAYLSDVPDGAGFAGNQCLMGVLPLPDGGTTYRTALYDRPGRFYMASFSYTPVAGRRPELLLRSPVGTIDAPGTCTWSHMLLVTREDWDHMSKHNVDYFDGDGYLTGVGGLLL